MTQFVALKTALYVQIDNFKPAYILVILLTITINIILDVLFAITNYQLLYVYLIVSIASLLISHTLILLVYR